MKNILCYGDSNTYGCNPEWSSSKEMDLAMRFDKNMRWPGILAELLGNEYHVVEEGLPGRTTVFDDPVLPYRNGRSYFVPCLKSHEPLALIIVMLGTNDMKSVFTPTPLLIGKGMEELIRIAKNPYLWEYQKVPDILLIAPPLIEQSIVRSPFYEAFGSGARSLSKKLSGVYREIAQKYDCIFLDAAKTAIASDLDAVHLDAANHKLLARAAAEKIFELFQAHQAT